METVQSKQVDPSKILQIGMGFFASKTLLTAVNLGLFTLLSQGRLSAKEIQSRFDRNDRNLYDFLDALVALGFLERTGLKETAYYKNTEESAQFLDKNKASYVGGILEMANNRLYPFWSDLDEALVTGAPQNESKQSGVSIFEEIYKDSKLLKEFVNGMAGIQMANFMLFSQKFDFSSYKTLCDIGGSGAHLSLQIAKDHPHMQCMSFDLPPVAPIAQQNIEDRGLTGRVTIAKGDFFEDDFPNADIITMGNILHDWGRGKKRILMQKAFNALPKEGAYVVIENIIDDDRRQNAFGLLMSLNMLIETHDGYDFSHADFRELALEVGFKSTKSMALAGPTSAVIAFKNENNF